MNLSLKGGLLLLVKFGIGIILLYFAYNTLEPESLALIPRNWQGILMLAIGWIFNQLFCALRLKVILQIYGYSIGYWMVLKLTFASYFLSSFMPGAVLGDVAKVMILRYTHKQGSITELTIITILDRVMGLFSLWLMSFILSYFIELPESPVSQNILFMLRSLMVLFVVGMITAVVVNRYLPLLKSAMAGESQIKVVVSRLLEMIHVLLSPRTAVLVGVFALPLSLIAVAILIGAQAGVGSMLALDQGYQPEFLKQAFLAPASLIISVLPISPSGIGIGQFTLAAAYEIAGLQRDIGIVLATMVQISQILVAGSLGGFGLLVLKQKSPEKIDVQFS